MSKVVMECARPVDAIAIDFHPRPPRQDGYLINTTPPARIRSGRRRLAVKVLLSYVRVVLSGVINCPRFPDHGHLDLTRILERLFYLCLLYTSDAADDLLCVDLGGR